MLGVIFRKAQNKIQDPAKLRRLIVDLIEKPGPGPGDTWSSLSADVKGDAYEGLLQKNAEDGNGRVIRLQSHAQLIRHGIAGHSLWTLSRGLARHSRCLSSDQVSSLERRLISRKPFLETDNQTVMPLASRRLVLIHPYQAQDA